MLTGVAMDYTLFLLSAAREHYDQTGDPQHAMRMALRTSGRVVVAAAGVMVAVFLTFALSGPLAPKEMGIILAVAVFLDALCIRLILLPVVLRLTGHGAWHQPRWLGPDPAQRPLLPLTQIHGATTIRHPCPTTESASPSTPASPRASNAPGPPLAEQGFGVLTEIDVAATMKAKLGKDMTAPPDPRCLQPAPGPPGPRRSTRPSGCFCPGNVVVRIHSTTVHTLVEAMNPDVMVTATGNPNLAAVAAEAHANASSPHSMRCRQCQRERTVTQTG